ncbi:MAG: TSUP family transporter [Candidatus Latescibacteria bacterium]|nr:TSUP family transporter [Candidatus Latescibacterota bacterium]
MNDGLVLVGVSFFSSMLTAVIGMGGGILLISAMPGFVPPGAIVPLHGVVQLASNASRTLFGLRHIQWRLFWPFVGGAVVGAALGSQIVARLPPDYLPLLLGLFILLATWGPTLSLEKLPGKYVSLGAAQTLLSMVFGVAGPLSAPFLSREGLSRDRLVVTHGTLMTAVHGLKVAAFGLLGFSFLPHAKLLIGMVLAVTLGSYVGTRLRHRLSEAFFKRLFKWVVTALALRMILRVFL